MPTTLLQSDLPGLNLVHRGKVRDVFDLGDGHLLMVATDRLSAFDADWFTTARENPYRVFGLTADASDAEVDQAYRRLISQYHPDRLEGAAPELRARAEARARELNAAYDRIKQLRKK